MKLFFKKEGEKISVNIKDNGEKDFDYITMIKSLIKENEFEESEFEGEFTAEEKQSVATILKGISDAITEDDEISEEEPAEEPQIKYDSEIKAEDLPF